MTPSFLPKLSLASPEQVSHNEIHQLEETVLFYDENSTKVFGNLCRKRKGIEKFEKSKQKFTPKKRRKFFSFFSSFISFSGCCDTA